jgi:hypothetical protein
MNFPDVPFDESLFDANDMMKSYWERSTDNRHNEHVSDVPREEKTVHEELQNELYALSMESFNSKSSQAQGKTAAAEAEEALVVVGLPKKVAVDALVTEKSTAGTVTVLALVTVVAIFLIGRAIMGKNRSRY